MRTLHRAMMGGFLVLALAIAVGVVAPAGLSALAQHGHGEQWHSEAAEHFAVVAERLELTDEQRQAVAAPFAQAFAAMQELHRLHGVIAAELTEGQKQAFAEMVHETLGVSFTAQQHDERPHQEPHR